MSMSSETLMEAPSASVESHFHEADWIFYAIMGVVIVVLGLGIIMLAFIYCLRTCCTALTREVIHERAPGKNILTFCDIVCLLQF